MKVKYIELPNGRYVVQVKVLGLFKRYIDNLNPLRFGTWKRSKICEAICRDLEHATEMADLYKIKCSL